MGNIISIGDSLVITVFSMAIVFVVLIAISYLIDILRITTNGNEGKKKSNIEDTKTQKPAISKTAKVEENVNDEEIVAVISAAIAASLGVATQNLNIKSIRRIPQTNPIWSDIGRREQMMGRL